MPLLDLTDLHALQQELAHVRQERRRLEDEEAHLIAHIAEAEEKEQEQYGCD